MKRMNKVIICACLAALAGCAQVQTVESTQDGDWIVLFDGKTLDGWTPKFVGFPIGVNYADTFRVEDGAITASYENYNGFDGRFGHLFYKTPYSHYRLRFEYRIFGEPAADIPVWAFRNSGVMIHSVCPDAIALDWEWPTSLEFQLLAGKDDGEPRPTGNVCTPGTNIEYDGEFTERHCTLSSSPTFENGAWVKGEILVLGDEKIVHYINGEQVLEYAHPTYGGPGSPDFDTLPLQDGQAADGGFIALQAEGQPVQFRNIELMNLDGPPKDAKSYCN